MFTDTSITKYYLDNAGCLWQNPTNNSDVLLCGDGTTCSMSVSGASCCNDKGKRAQCPLNMPNMCAEPNACAGGHDYCCETDCTCQGGIRSCKGSAIAPLPAGLHVNRKKTAFGGLTFNSLIRCFLQAVYASVIASIRSVGPEESK